MSETNRSGEVIAQSYELTRLIKEDDEGQLYEARDRDKEQTLVVKRYTNLSMAAQDDAFIERAQRLCQCSRSTPHIVNYEEAGFDPTLGHYIVRKHVQAEPLTHWLRAGRSLMKLPQIVSVLLQVCHGLQKLHQNELTHKGLAPDSILMVRQGDKGEFVQLRGIALTRPISYTGTPESLHTHPAYLAPEQLQGEEADHRVDLYALGVLAYKMLAGVVPYRRSQQNVTQEAWETWASLSQTPPQPPSTQATTRNLPASFDQLAMRAIQYHPEERFGDVGSLAQALLDAAQPLEMQMALGGASDNEPDLNRQTGEYVASGSEQPKYTKPTSIPSLPERWEDASTKQVLDWGRALQALTPTTKDSYSTDEATDTFQAISEEEAAALPTTPTKPPTVAPVPSVSKVDRPSAPTPAAQDAPFDQDEPFAVNPKAAEASFVVPVTELTSPSFGFPSVEEAPPPVAAPSVASPSIEEAPPQSMSFGSEETFFAKEEDQAPSGNKLTLILGSSLALLLLIGGIAMFSGSSASRADQPPKRTKGSTLAKAEPTPTQPPVREREAPQPRQDTTPPPARRAMDFSGGFAPAARPRQVAPTPRPAITPRVKRPKVAAPRRRPKRIKKRRRPIRPRLRVVRRKRRVAPKRRVRRGASGCRAAAGMRSLRLRSIGIPLSKVMVRVGSRAISPKGRGCIQVPKSTRMLMLAYKPDVTAYHLCQLRLRGRTRIRFKLIDANLVPPEGGDCSK